MKKTAQWFAVAALAASGLVGFACGGGNQEAHPPAAGSGSAPATSSAAPVESSTASASAAASTATPAPPAPPLAVVAMKMVLPKAKGPVVLKDDGTVEANGKTVMKFVGAELQDKDGKAVASVAADGTVTLDGANKSPKFNAKDELEVGDGAKMFVTDAGVLKLVNPDGKEDKDSGKVKFVGFKPSARRAATVLVLAALMVSGPPKAGPATVTAAPPAHKK